MSSSIRLMRTDRGPSKRKSCTLTALHCTALHCTAPPPAALYVRAFDPFLSIGSDWFCVLCLRCVCACFPLCRDEIAMLAIELGSPMTDEEVEEAMAEMDSDGGGDVDWEEFLFWWQDQQNKPPGQSSAFKFADALNSAFATANKQNERRQARRGRKGLAQQAAANANSVNAMRGR
eukprot:COSAG06_NODE_12_length_35417_cov_270.698992_2_plen_176_part_00